MLNNKIKSKIENILGSQITKMNSLSGGCISSSYKVNTKDGNSYFLKYNYSSGSDMFLTEAHGLQELDKPGVITIPKVISFDKEFILLDLIENSGRSKNFFEDFGRKFAVLHKFNNEKYGFYEDNYIGSNPQLNIPDNDEEKNWTKFYFQKRILYQFHLAEKSGNSTSDLRSSISKLENKIDLIVTDNSEKPSLLHGDLWGGNYMVDKNGFACLIDPAVYYGNREADLAMTKLFGGFDSEFYRAYNEEFPLPDGYDYRENIYKLYHVLNHLNLFGSGYYSQAISLIKYYL